VNDTIQYQGNNPLYLKNIFKIKMDILQAMLQSNFLFIMLSHKLRNSCILLSLVQLNLWNPKPIRHNK